jgi:microsomal dipeptidase-like Zn-dependent dipeptidase
MNNGENDSKKRSADMTEAFGDILKRVTRKDVPKKKSFRNRRLIERTVKEVLGAEQAALVKPGIYRAGTLRLDVSAVALLHELRSFREQELLDAFRAAGLRVAAIHWRLAEKNDA